MMGKQCDGVWCCVIGSVVVTVENSAVVQRGNAARAAWRFSGPVRKFVRNSMAEGLMGPTAGLVISGNGWYSDSAV